MGPAGGEGGGGGVMAVDVKGACVDDPLAGWRTRRSSRRQRTVRSPV
jgi:hypothetical protein